LVTDFSESVLVALPGDLNFDGRVDVLGDAFRLVGNLGVTANTNWSQGDFNGDGVVDVLGDAFILVANLGRTVNPVISTPPATSRLASSTLPTTEATLSASTPVLVNAVSEDEKEDGKALVTSLDAVFAGEEEFLLLS